jgi:lambda family phage minor tail protein L
MSLIAALTTLTPGTLVHMYEIEKADGSIVRFSSYNHANNSPIQMYDYDDNSQLNTYYTLPIHADGFEKNQAGAIARPKLNVSTSTDSTNPEVSFKKAIGSDFHSLLGQKIVRRTTMDKYLKDGSADTESGNTPVEFSREVWIIDKVSSEDAMSVEFELNAPFDLDGVMVPKRTIVGNGCAWEYQGASPTRKESQKIGGCSWHTHGEYRKGSATKFALYVNQDDHYILPNSGVVSWDSLTGNVTINTLYSYNQTVVRMNADGSYTSVTQPSYWQARSSGTKASKGTPSENNSNFVRAAVYDDYNASTTYYAYTDDRYNNYVRKTEIVNPPTTLGFPSTPSNGATASFYAMDWTYVSANTAWEATGYSLWQAKTTNTGNTPGFGAYWKKGDICGKRLSSCSRRFNASPSDLSSASSNPKADELNTATLPFGAFPGSKRFD